MLESLFNPGAIAAIGTSADPKKVGHAVLGDLGTLMHLMLYIPLCCCA